MNAKGRAEIKNFKRKLAELENSLSQCKGCGSLECLVRDECEDNELSKKQRKAQP